MSLSAFARFGMLSDCLIRAVGPPRRAARLERFIVRLFSVKPLTVGSLSVSELLSHSGREKVICATSEQSGDFIESKNTLFAHELHFIFVYVTNKTFSI